MASEDPSIKAVQVKLVLLGEAAVGKSSLVLRFVQNDFNENTSPTIGAAFLTQKCRLESRVVKFEIWDTAGQVCPDNIERFHSLAPMYYRNAQAAVVVYDITKASSLEKAKAWVKELQRQASPNIVIALVGNKLDLVDGETSKPAAPVDSETSESEEAGSESGSEAAGASGAAGEETESLRQVSTAEAEQYAKEAHLLFFEASAKTGQNVGDLFTEIAKTIPIDVAQPKPAPVNKRNTGAAQQGGNVDLGDGQQAKKAGGCC